MGEAHTATDRLPSLPQVLIRVLDAVQAENGADFRDLNAAVSPDSAMAARLLAAANSPFYFRGAACESLDRALVLLGQHAIKTLTMTAAIQQLFDSFEDAPRDFLPGLWRRALIAANLGQVLATLTRHPNPEQAYLCGLLLEMGKLARLSQDPAGYGALLGDRDSSSALADAEIAELGSHYAQFTGDIMQHWGLCDTLCDAVRYQLEDAGQVRDAQHLVKIMNVVAGLVDAENSARATTMDRALAAADELFGLNEGLVRELRHRIDDDVRSLAGSLGIPFDESPEALTEQQRTARRTLGQRVGDVNSADQFAGALQQASGLPEAGLAVRRCLQVTLGLPHALAFWLTDDGQSLTAFADDGTDPLFVIAAEPNRSLVADCLLAGEIRQDDDRNPLSPVVDRQIRRRLGGHPLWCLPLLRGEQCVGVLVLGIPPGRDAELRQRLPLLQALCRELARAPELTAPATDTALPAGAVSDDVIREVVHEAGNPLSIIQNYLGVLRSRLASDDQAQEQLQQIRREIDRVGRILLRLRDPQDAADDDTAIPARALLERIADLMDTSLCQPRGITLELELDDELPVLQKQTDQLQQVLTNLLKNAVEALDQGGTIRLRAEGHVLHRGQRHWRIRLSDDGPGLPSSVNDRLFSPLQSTKGAGHSGLGLSIAKRLMDEMKGKITVQSDATGTRFELLLPVDEGRNG